MVVWKWRKWQPCTVFLTFHAHRNVLIKIFLYSFADEHCLASLFGLLTTPDVNVVTSQRFWDYSSICSSPSVWLAQTFSLTTLDPQQLDPHTLFYTWLFAMREFSPTCKTREVWSFFFYSFNKNDSNSRVRNPSY